MTPLRLKRKILCKDTVYKSIKTLSVAELVDIFNFTTYLIFGELTVAWSPGHGPMSDTFIGEIFFFFLMKSCNHRPSSLNDLTNYIIIPHPHWYEI